MTRAISRTIFLILILLSLSSCAKRSHPLITANDQQSIPSVPANEQPRINLNRASVKDLEALPGIGKGLAARIVEHREKYGPFRRAEHLIAVRGISDRRYRALRDLVMVE
jgi:competence ComEA-like helix-hairpin-helix protein